LRIHSLTTRFLLTLLLSTALPFLVFALYARSEMEERLDTQLVDVFWPDQAEACHKAVANLVETMPGWTLSTGKAIVEARRKDIDKGAVVTRLMRTEPFTGRLPVFIGDDVTDEDGMMAATQLGGFGVKVGESDSVARFHITDVPAARALLSEIASKGIPRRFGSEETATRNETLTN